MTNSPMFLNSLIFLALGCIHFYWAFGGDKGLKYAIPTDPEKNNAANFKPGMIITMIVGIGLCFFAWCYASLVYNWTLPFINVYLKYIVTGIAVIFVIRGVGDFKYAGLFKKVKGTLFSKKDTLLFTPLCLWLGITTLLHLYA